MWQRTGKRKKKSIDSTIFDFVAIPFCSSSCSISLILFRFRWIVKRQQRLDRNQTKTQCSKAVWMMECECVSRYFVYTSNAPKKKKMKKKKNKIFVFVEKLRIATKRNSEIGLAEARASADELAQEANGVRLFQRYLSFLYVFDAFVVDIRSDASLRAHLVRATWRWFHTEAATISFCDCCLLTNSKNVKRTEREKNGRRSKS